MLSRIPDDSVIVADRVTTEIPGAGRYRFAATRDIGGSYALVYAPVGRPFKVRMDKITGEKVKAWWFNPRTGQGAEIGEFSNKGEREFAPPDLGEQLDWVLVLDDASRNYPPPGQTTPPKAGGKKRALLIYRPHRGHRNLCCRSRYRRCQEFVKESEIRGSLSLLVAGREPRRLHVKSRWPLQSVCDGCQRRQRETTRSFASGLLHAKLATNI